MATVTVTFEWPQDANINPLTTEPFTAAQLRGVDAQETSLIAGKLRHSRPRTDRSDSWQAVSDS